VYTTTSVYKYTTCIVTQNIILLSYPVFSTTWKRVSSDLYAGGFVHISRSEKTGLLTDLKISKTVLFPSLLI